MLRLPSEAQVGYKASMLGADELEQLLRVAKHIISFVTVIRPRRGGPQVEVDTECMISSAI